MDASPSNPINPAVPRQRSSPVNDPSSSPAPAAQQQPYPYPVQQQQAGWSPSHSPQQYYPSFYQNHHQQSYPMHGPPAHAQQPHMHPQAPYYDQANAQFAQWAYQQMMFNAHQVHQMSHVPSPMGTQRSRSGTGNASDFIPGFAPFPSGTPPRHPAQLPNGYSSSSDHGQYQGFHPYRRPPQRQQPHNQDTHPPPGTEWSPAHQGSFQPPYARSDAAGSSTSVNSTGSGTGGSRPRTNSMQRAEPSNAPPPNHTHPKPSSSNGHGRAGSATSNASSQAPVNAVPRPHPRTTSSSSSSSAAAPRPSPAPAPAPAPAPHGPSTLRKPSPLSQGTFTAAEKRMSRDDSDLAAMLEPSPNAPGVRSGGLKGRLRRALSMNASATLREEDEGDDDGPAHVSGHRVAASQGANHVDTDTESTATVQKKKSRSLFNSRLNRSTDNISLSSTMSSASVVIRKLGNIGKLARRNSLAGITSLFKDKKDKDKDGDDGKKGKKGEKGTAAEASVSHATAELDRSDWTAGADLAGLSPAARLARQHTLKSNAEAAAKAKAEQEARAAAAAAAAAQQQADPALPTTWEKNTTSRQANDPLKLARAARVHEDGMRVIVEDDDSDSDDGKSDGDHQHHHYNADGWDDDEDWGEGQDEEDVTIRAGLEQAHLDDGGEEMEPWAINVRRSIEKTRRPTKGILKNGLEYQQDQYLQTPNPAFTRLRSNSYDSAPSQHGELGPLAHMPSSDPDHIDGLHKHNHASNGNGHGVPGQVGFIPPLSFDSNGLTLDSPKDASDTGGPAVHAPEKGFFNHSNSSAPALSATFSPNPPTLSQRSATAPAKRLAFASNLSVYDTFPATVYDRRSEPATWSRLTPALAQRIKEELNSYKMEEMEVHAASRVHTQFFV